MRGAEELANDLHHALEVVEAQRDEAIRERDEAHATIDAVRKVRERIATRKRLHYDRWNETDNPADAAAAASLSVALGLLDEVDGL